MPSNNNDLYNIDQSNGALDSDMNLNGASVTQGGSGEFAWDTQDITSGGNTQTNGSAIVDSGWFNYGDHSQDDNYSVDQSNNLFDSDHNENAFVDMQVGFGNIVGADQSSDSGGNSQSNYSDIYDGGFTGAYNTYSNNDSYDMTQFNGMRDEDANVNSLHTDQYSAGPLFGDLSFASQDISSGGNDQMNSVGVYDDGSTSWFGGLYNNDDSFTVDQSNEMLDNDQDVNAAHLGQLGGFEFSYSNQDISSGGNSQENSADLTDTGSSGYFLYNDNNDVFNVGQSNQMADNDADANQFTMSQGLLFELGGANQSIDSGGNHQDNSAGLYDFGTAYGFGANSNDDHYTLDQGNMMVDNDINLNIGTVTQAGFGNTASLDEGISSGSNSQTNSSNVYDTGFSFGGWSNDDTYDVHQTNLLTDSDSNQNLGSMTEIGGPGDFADLSQMIDSGSNSAGNHSNVYDFGA